MNLRATSMATSATIAAAYLAGGCTGGDPEERELLDARSYYVEYEEGQGDGVGGRATTHGTTSAVREAAPDRTSAAMPPARDWPPGVLQDNTFVDAGDSEFIGAADDPTSTFGLDVDTGSYSVARELVEQGHPPPPASIRVEEWVNAFDYGYAPPDEGDFTVDVETAPAPYAEDGTRLVRLGIQAREIPDDKRPPAAITFVVDTSGSMDIRERLGLVKSSLALLTNTLRDDDTIAIVTYGDSSHALLPPTPVREIGAIEGAISGLRPGGSTNLDSGLRLGYREARAGFREDAVNVVVLASDGVANVGTTNPDRLAARIRREGDDGIHLVTVGFGMGNYNDDLMEQLADQGNGFYSYVDTFKEARRLFVEDLTSTLTVVAGDARTQVEFDPSVVRDYRLLGYQNRALADDAFRDDAVDAGELGAGHTVTALYEVRPSEGAEPVDAQTIGELRLRWESAASGEVEELVRPIPLSGADAESSNGFRMASTVASTAELLRGDAPVSARGATLDMLAEDASALARAGQPGAAGLADLIGRIGAAKTPR
ncbi:MAG: DUF3520 domain-containing protein [Propionibacteriales bacterium]|nr:DUF3520 domain-containing protein [Propionibacteriales bacterium]